MKIIDRGAEAVISADGNAVIKERLQKGYRLKEIDDKLRKFRTRREAKVLEKLQQIDFPAPRLMDFCDHAMQIRMEMIKGNKIRDILYQNPIVLSEEMGRKIGILHQNDIIHGDLTTSNMILDKEIKFIDFGLSFFSNKVEDKAVDIHLLRQALESKHYQNWEQCFNAVLKGYKESYPGANLVLTRFDEVEKRGKNKAKY